MREKYLLFQNQADDAMIYPLKNLKSIEAASKQGDYLNVMCDGTTWNFEAHSAVSNGFTTS